MTVSGHLYVFFAVLRMTAICGGERSDYQAGPGSERANIIYIMTEGFHFEFDQVEIL